MRWLPSAALQPRLSKYSAVLTVDVVLLDFDLGDEQGNHFISSARQSGYTGKILMVTAGMNAKESSAALKLGASGILLKHSSPGTLANAIRLVAQGELWVDQKVIQQMADCPARRPTEPPTNSYAAGGSGAPGCVRRTHKQRNRGKNRCVGRFSEGNAQAIISQNRRANAQPACPHCARRILHPGSPRRLRFDVKANMSARWKQVQRRIGPTGRDGRQPLRIAKNFGARPLIPT